MTPTTAFLDLVTAPTAAGFFNSALFWGPVALAFGLAIRWWGSRTPEPHSERSAPDPFEAAYLCGGSDRVADAVLAGLYRSGRIELRKPRTLSVLAPRPDGLNHLQAAAWDVAAARGTVDDARRAVSHAVSGRWLADLARRGLALTPRGRRRLSFFSALPLVLLLGATLLRFAVGWHWQEPSEGVVWLAIALLLFVVWFASNPPRATDRGRRAIRRLKKDHRRVAALRGENAEHWAWTCGLFGVMALPESEAADLQSGLRPGNSGDSADNPDGGSGCSGCGGCGGCGD